MTILIIAFEFFSSLISVLCAFIHLESLFSNYEMIFKKKKNNVIIRDLHPLELQDVVKMLNSLFRVRI